MLHPENRRAAAAQAPSCPFRSSTQLGSLVGTPELSPAAWPRPAGAIAVAPRRGSYQQRMGEK